MGDEDPVGEGEDEERIRVNRPIRASTLATTVIQYSAWKPDAVKRTSRGTTAVTSGSAAVDR